MQYLDAISKMTEWSLFISKQTIQYHSNSRLCPNLCLLVKVKESEKVGLKLNIQKTKIMALVPITSWETDEETVETVSDFLFWAPKSLQMVTAAMKLKDAYSLEEKL